MSIDHKMEEVRQLYKDGKKSEAWLLMRELIEENSNNARLWSLQGSLYARNENYTEAIASTSRAILLSPEQSIFYNHRGRYNLLANNLLEAIDDFTNAIDKDDYQDSSFTEELYFHRAEAFIRLGKKLEALLDLSHIPDDYRTWTFKLRSKADLIADCTNL